VEEKPRLRGVLHAVACLLACVAGGLLIGYAAGGRQTAAAAVFAGSAALCLGASAAYHLLPWSPRARLVMRRVDHAGIYLLIAGTYTPVGLLSLHGVLQRIVLAIVWSGAAAATVVRFAWATAPRWLTGVIGIALGWAGVAALPQLAERAGVGAVVLLAAGGLAYTLGAIVYASRRPNPAPRVFGFHEVFHALTIVALACQYAAIAFFVVR
jgi:hemolysin III